MPFSFNYDATRVLDAQGNDIDCGAVSYALLGIEEQYPQIDFDPVARSISVYGDNPVNHVDEFPLVIESCITFRGQLYACRNSTVFRVIISNPCDTSVILAQPIPNTASAPIQGYDFIPLIETSAWPWSEQFVVAGVAYTDYCKPFSYDIVYMGTN